MEHLHHMGGCDVKFKKSKFQIAFPYGNRRSFVFQLDRPDVYSGSVCMRILYSDPVHQKNQPVFDAPAASIPLL